MFKNFMKDRYGLDNLTFIILAFALIFVTYKYVWIISVLLVGWALFRVLSKNRQKRVHELQVYSAIINKIVQWIMKGIYKLKSRRTGYKSRQQQKQFHVFVKCPKCKNKLRLPKNKGKLMVTCPVCKQEFIKKT